MEDDIREGHSVRSLGEKPGRIAVRENDNYVIMDKHYDDLALSPEQARYIAAKLYRLARRVRQRNEGTAS